MLCRRLGAQTGASLWQHAHGLDERPVAPPKARRSVGAEVNWGVRFSNAQEADTFLRVGLRCCAKNKTPKKSRFAKRTGVREAGAGAIESEWSSMIAKRGFRGARWGRG